MKKNVLFILFVFVSFFGWSQSPDIKETLSLHLNTTVFLTGESLLFKVYVLNQNTISDFSKLAYVELVDERARPLSQMKVALTNGEGIGDYYFDSTVPTGNYTLVAYTRWMRNFGPQNFYRQTITVVNPELVKPIHDDDRTMSPSLQPNGQASTQLKVVMPKNIFKTREKVTVQLVPSEAISASINIRSVEPTLTPLNSEVFSSVEGVVRNRPLDFMPDLRGELITGLIVDKLSGKPLTKELVALSAPSSEYSFLISRSDSTGRFYFNAANIQSGYVFIQPLRKHPDDVSITVDNSFLMDYKQLAPYALQINEQLLKALQRRYLSSQVENAFRAVKKDSVLKPHAPSRFVATPDKIYHLDAFTRFPTMEDVFREIIPEVSVKLRDGNYSLSIKNMITGERFFGSPLILIDGIPVMNVNDFMRFNPALINDIVVVAQRYYYGGLETEGVISAETFKGNGEGFNTSNLLRVDYLKPSPLKLFYFPNYEEPNNLSRVPDFRSQLYWEPNLKLEKSSEITFYTSDLPGEYSIEVFGVTKTGQKISAKAQFSIAK